MVCHHLQFGFCGVGGSGLYKRRIGTVNDLIKVDSISVMIG
ncbi:MAG: hypothetical protein UW22_C0045G0020 [Candidatus Gottesmanbacteria bacterium GW2011_GWB1_44_11c]|uniref:Uncharacterized protein n=1 Tax=Candidatus Gottesmanbacteria bacterium GW2011_GWB1_44_11c TaxID=1618447 RepID=A0A0G1GNH0_9BACT|nr:MAG: hypothetical protein UW22_C0045G0020 [Candidatus Gottesmanbacteria bacterium GW2011_GWB1_44_11c]